MTGAPTGASSADGKGAASADGRGAPSARPERRGEHVRLALTTFVPLVVTLPGGAFLLPLLAPLTIYRAFSARVRERRWAAAWSLGVAWAALLSLGVCLLVLYLPETAARGILHGPAYRSEMFGWVATGEAPENHPAQFLPQHLFHLGAFALLAWASAGYLGLVLGAFLVDYMSYFVGSYAVASGHPGLGLVAAWVPWSVIRVFAFVLLGCLLARPLLVRPLQVHRLWRFERAEARLFALAAAGIVADALLKTFLAPTYGLFLRRLVETGHQLLP